MPTDDISQMDIKEAFYTLITYLDDAGLKDEDGEEIYDGLEEAYKKARYGLKIRFDLYDYLFGTMQLKQKTGKALYRARSIELSELWTELEERTIVCKKWLKEHREDPFAISAYNLEEPK